RGQGLVGADVLRVVGFAEVGDIAGRQAADRDGRRGRGAGGAVVALAVGLRRHGDGPRGDHAGRVGDEGDGVVVAGVAVADRAARGQRLVGADVPGVVGLAEV